MSQVLPRQTANPHGLAPLALRKVLRLELMNEHLHPRGDRHRAGKTKVIRRRGPWRGFEDVGTTPEWVAWFNQQLLLAPLGAVRAAWSSDYRTSSIKPLCCHVRPSNSSTKTKPRQRRW